MQEVSWPQQFKEEKDRVSCSYSGEARIGLLFDVRVGEERIGIGIGIHWDAGPSECLEVRLEGWVQAQRQVCSSPNFSSYSGPSETNTNSGLVSKLKNVASLDVMSI